MNRSAVVLLAGLLALAPPTLAEEPAAPAVAAPAPQPSEFKLKAPSLKAEEPAAKAQGLVLAPPLVRPEPPKNYWVPVLEITGWNIIQNRWSYYTGDTAVYDVNWDTWKYNLQHWWWDEDQFSTNGFAHPYMGSLYFNMARGNGLSFWESAGYAFGGSLMWEYFGETERPSYNDQITTPWAGTILGEILFRLSNRVLDAGGANPGFWTQFGALAIDPAGGFNRILYGNKYRPASDLNDQPFHDEFKLSVGLASDAKENGVWHSPGVPVALQLRFVNGMPGGDWAFRRPFDYYDATFSLVVNKNITERTSFLTLLFRGAVAASMYGEGTSRGLWGLYFDYDYIAPSIFRVESSTLDLGTTGQIDWGVWALQGHTALGVGFGAAGSSSETLGLRDYHFGAQVAGQLEGTLFYEDTVRLGVRLREYLTGSKVTDQEDAWEDITYATASVVWRFKGPHAVGVEGIASRRAAHYGANAETGAPAYDINGKYGTVQLVYQLMGDPEMGRIR